MAETATSTPPSTEPDRPTVPPRWPHAWWLLALPGGLLILAYHLLPSGLLGDLAYTCTGALAVAAVLLGTRLHQPERRGAWYALAASQALWTVGDLSGTLQTALAPTNAFPTVADAFYVAGYLPLGLCLFLLTRGRRPIRDVRWALDGATVAVALFLLCWVLLARPVIRESASSWLTAAAGAAYPLLDVAVLVMLMALVVTPGTQTVALRLFSVAMLLVIIPDTSAPALGMLSLGSTTTIDFLWMTSYLVIGASALHPSMRELSRTGVEEEPRFGRRRQVATVAALFVAPGVLAVEHVLGMPLDVWAVVVGSVAMKLLVFARMTVAIREIQAANDNRDRAQRELAHQAAHDSLTDLPNRAQALKLIGGSLSRAQRSGAMIGLLFIDLDGFKKVNDTFGHRAGDDVLRTTAARMEEVIRAGDMVGRLGGDEFVVLLEPVVEEASAVVVGERLVAAVSQPILLAGGQRVTIGASVGVVVSQDAETAPDTLLVEADTAAYRAKSLGRGRVEVFDAALRRELHAHAELEQALRVALAEEQLLLHYQRIVQLDGGVTGYEALLHWQRPGVGLVAVPDIRLDAEASDLIFDLDAWALRHAAQQVARWTREGLPDQRVSVRVSVRHAGRSRILDDVRAAVEQAGIAPWQLVVQISDVDLVDDVAVLANLGRLREGGTTISLDDFGIGHSSVRRLQHLPVDAVKVHSSLLQATSGESRELLGLMVRGVQNFGLTTVVKGVDDEERLQAARVVGSNFAQGALVGGLADGDEVVRHASGAVPVRS